MFINTEGEHMIQGLKENSGCDVTVGLVDCGKAAEQRSAEVMAGGKRGKLPCRH